MNATPPSLLQRGLAMLLIAVTLLALAAPAAAAELSAAVPAVLPALDMSQIVHDRSRLIQFSVVAVALGIAVLWWGNKT